MPKNIEHNFWNCFEIPNPGLRSYFGKVREGNPVEYRTTFYKGSTAQDVLKQWLPYIEKISKRWPTLYQYEIDLANKVGPMSVMLPLRDRMTDIDSYYESVTYLHSQPLSRRAEAAVLKEWCRLRGLIPRSQRATLDSMRLSTNSGSPFFTKRSAVVDQTVPVTINFNYPYVEQVLDGRTFGAAAVLGWRGQEGGPNIDDVKQRVIWMFPFGVNICELQIYQPLVESAQKWGLVPAWISMDEVSKCVTRLFDTKPKADLVVCTDFTKFDQHFNSNLQLSALRILSGILGHTRECLLWLSEVFPVKYNIPLAYDWGKIRFGTHGMGSGSGGTNTDETLVHRALQYEAAQRAGEILNPYSQCLGDDGILTYPGITVDSVVESYTKHGLLMNVSKQYAATDHCIYLRRWYHEAYRYRGMIVGVYSTCRALGRLLEQERFHDPEKWGPKMVALRQLSILQNCEYHPLREEFVKFCIKGDKYRLGIDIPGFLDNIQIEAQEAMNKIPDLIGYIQQHTLGVTGIGNWWIVKYLKSL